MKKLVQSSILMACFTVLTLSTYANPITTENSVEFYEGNFDSAKSKAMEEGKLFFVDFYADWCLPCKWMDETTFKNSEVVDILNDNFVALKVDVDELDGFELRQKFGVNVFPTLLVFGADGSLIKRIEETMPPSQLAGILDELNVPDNKSTTHGINTSPKKTIEKPSEEKIEIAAPTSIDPSILEQEVLTTSEKSQPYRIQVGVFRGYENAVEIVSNLQENFEDPIIVHNDYDNGEVLYRVMMGEFDSYGEAVSFKSLLKNDFDLDGIVK